MQKTWDIQAVSAEYTISLKSYHIK